MSETETAAHQAGDIVHLTLGQLVAAKDNPRKDKEKTADPILVASIRSRGLLQNLGVRPSEKSPGKFEIKYGSRRHAALKTLAKEGHFAKDKTFACRISAEDEEDAAEEQLAENIGRKAMNPVDEFEAFAALEAKGLAIEDIAARFGADVRAVKQRLALGSAAPCVRQALRTEAITLEVARIFAGCPDLARQERVFREIDKAGHFSPWNVKKLLHEGALSDKDDIVRFVTLEAYEAAGGAVERDLFSNEARILDTELVLRLRDEKLAAEVERLMGEGWSWVEAHERHDWQLTKGLDRLYGAVVPHTPEEKAEIEALENELGTLESKPDEDWSDEDYTRCEEIEERLADLRDRRREFTPEQKAVSGCVICPSRDGLSIEAGLVRKEDRKRAAPLRAGRSETGADLDEEDDAAAIPPAPDAGYGIGLRADLAAFRAQACQAAIAMDADTAVLAHQFLLVQAVFKDIYGRFPSGSTLRTAIADLRVGNGDLGATPAAAMLETAAKTIRSDIFAGGNWQDSWRAFKSLKQGEREALVAFAFSKTIEPMNSRSAFADLIAFEMGLDIRRYWRPTGENFFSRVKKDELIAFLKETVGDAGAARLTGDFKAKKTELVALCESLIDGGAPIDAKARAVLDFWAPPVMRFSEPAAPGVDDFDDDDFDDDLGEDDELAPDTDESDEHSGAAAEAA